MLHFLHEKNQDELAPSFVNMFSPNLMNHDTLMMMAFDVTSSSDTPVVAF